ncbi:hypothetical protein [Microbacterium sp. P02]|uniref:hypothetical protein n=1 Tax=Microbacterium sp. P02 TaxID=3366260 RepID=UPI0036717A84
MTDSYDTGVQSTSGTASADSPGTLDSATQEAAGLTHTTADQAKSVAGTAKDEASSVVGDVKTQAKDLFAQTQSELKDQANTQQQRLAGGLSSVSDELGSMADESQGSGIAADLVRQVSTRLSSASSWLGDRDPASVFTEVKQYARRSPGTFIVAAAVIGVVAGRLTKALTANAADDKASGATPRTAADDVATDRYAVAAPAEVPAVGVHATDRIPNQPWDAPPVTGTAPIASATVFADGEPDAGDTPIFEQSSTTAGDSRKDEDDRPDTF